MWSSKKPEKPQSAEAERKHLQISEPSSKSNQDAKLPTGAGADGSSRLGSSFKVKGEISGSGDLSIDGTLDGHLQVDGGKLTIGPQAKITADIRAGAVVVHGTVKGNVRAEHRIEIKTEGSVTGDLITPQILIEDGAYFKGTIEIERSADKPAENVSSRMESVRPAAFRAAR